jgi:hypothetical protein
MKNVKNIKITIKMDPNKVMASVGKGKLSSNKAEKGTLKDNVCRIIKKYFTTGMLQLVVGIIAAIGTWWALYQDPIEKLKKDIDEQISIIQSEFRPNSLKVDLLSAPDTKLVKNFQVSALELVAQWRRLKNLKQINEYKELDSETMASIVQSQLKTMCSFDEAALKVLGCIYELLNFGNENYVISYIPDKDKIIYLIEKARQRLSNTKNELEKLENNIETLHNKYGGGDLNIIPIKEMKKAVRPHENIYKSENLEYIKTLTTFIVELNSIYMCHINLNSYR